MDQIEQKKLDFVSITTGIVSSYVANNAVHRGDLPNVIAAVHAALQGLTSPAPLEPEKPQPVVPVRKSITPDFLISLEDGKKYRTLKRHLSKLGLTPDEYRAKWGLPAGYPMVAPNYATMRSELARSSGLGQRRRKSNAVKQAVALAGDKVATSASKTKRRGPAKKARTAE